MDKFRIRIKEVFPIKTAKSENEFRHITLIDTKNKITIDYVIFKRPANSLWNDIIDYNYKNIGFPGQIKTIILTNELIKSVNEDNRNLLYNDGEPFDIVVWEWNDPDWENLNESERIKKSLKDQLWQITKH